MCLEAPYLIILGCLTPKHFAHQGESAATQWVKYLLCFNHIIYALFLKALSQMGNSIV